MENNQTVEYSYGEEAVTCPGKEIAVMICGIHSLFWSVFAALFSFVPFYGFLFLLIYGFVSLWGIIPSFILYSNIKKIATSIGTKGNIGKKLTIASIIVLAAAVLIAIIVAVIVIVFFGGIAALSIAGSGSY